jgi:hypothetical protein
LVSLFIISVLTGDLNYCFLVFCLEIKTLYVEVFNFFSEGHLDGIVFLEGIEFITLHHKVLLDEIFHINECQNASIHSVSALTSHFIEAEITWHVKIYLLKSKLGGLISKFFLKCINLCDAADNFLMAVLVRLNVEIGPDNEFTVETGMEDLSLK